MLALSSREALRPRIGARCKNPREGEIRPVGGLRNLPPALASGRPEHLPGPPQALRELLLEPIRERVQAWRLAQVSPWVLGSALEWFRLTPLLATQPGGSK